MIYIPARVGIPNKTYLTYLFFQIFIFNNVINYKLSIFLVFSIYFGMFKKKKKPYTSKSTENYTNINRKSYY